MSSALKRTPWRTAIAASRSQYTAGPSMLRPPPREPTASGAAAELGVEGVAEGVAEEVEGEDGQEDRQAGAGAHPPEQVGQVALGVVDVLAPGRGRRLGAEPEERERRLGQD